MPALVRVVSGSAQLVGQRGDVQGVHFAGGVFADAQLGGLLILNRAVAAFGPLFLHAQKP